jgi:flagellar assembly protein FliH
MSSKLYRPGDHKEAPSITWRAANGAPVFRGSASNGSPAVAREAEWQGRVEAAYQQGLSAGEAVGTQKASERLAAVLASLGAVTQELAGMRKRLRMEAEASVVELAIAIARRILHREVATDPEAVLGLVKSAAERLTAREMYRLRLSAGDAAVIQEQRARLNLPPGLEIVADGSLAAGSVVFETPRGELDASVGTQLDEIQRGLADMLHRRSR